MNRRDIIISLAATPLVVSFGMYGKAAAGGGDPYEAAVNTGLSYFKRLATEQIQQSRLLVQAIKGKNLAQAQAAYIAARPQYEEIEVLAASFPETDADMDSRPYAYELGESDPGFIGIHKVEALLFRDQDLAAALPYAQKVLGISEQLLLDLNKRQNFSAQLTFAGLIALSTEVAAKKISSEEETWSNQSLLIFRHNWRGIYSQYQPFAMVVKQRDAAAAEAVELAYNRAMAIVEPHFRPGNPAGTPYNQILTPERRAIGQASYQLRDALYRARDVLRLTAP
jgi:iron uptake system component EfeO